MPPLDGVAARLDRATEHIRNLETELRAFTGKHPYVDHPETDELAGTVTHRLVRLGPPAVHTRLAVLCGEIFFLLRSSLDHLVADLIISCTTGVAIPDKLIHRSMFPICTDASALEAVDWAKLPGITPQMKAAIVSRQPCHRTDGKPHDHPLAVISELNNIDKHRHLVVLNTRAEVTELNIDGTRSLVYDGGIPGSTRTGMVRAVIASRPYRPEEPSSFFTKWQVAFKRAGTREAVPIIPLLEDECLRFVRELVADFRQQFFPEMKTLAQKK